MGVDWSTSGVDLHLQLDGRGGRRAAIERALRDAVRSGRLAPGTRLPATRTLAADLGVARGTVVEAYAQLTAEGFLTARQGAGTAVAAAGAGAARADGTRAGGTGAGESAAGATAPAGIPDPALPRHDLRPGLSDPSAFPRDLWVRALRAALRRAPDAALIGGDPRGQPALRRALADYLRRARGVAADPERIVVCNGLMQGFGLVCRALADRGAQRIALEDPCIPNYRAAAAAAGLGVVALPVDDHGARAPGGPADAVLVTPAHQFPLGATMSPDRRTELVAWAREQDAWIVEDDYDGEFRYDRQPVGALQALDPGRVVYAGTASKALAPGLRLGWLVLPDPLLEPTVEHKRLADRASPALDQLALAELIDSGAFDRHVRRMRLRYRRRRDALLAIVARHAPGARVLGIAAGLHVVVQPAPGPSESELLARAAEQEVAVGGLGPFWHESRPRPAALVVGYGAAPGHGYPQALAALGRALAAGLSPAPPAAGRGAPATGGEGG